MATKDEILAEAAYSRAKKKPAGEGSRFAALKKLIAAKGSAKDPGAVAASIGRKKYGAKKMAAMAAAGRKG